MRKYLKIVIVTIVVSAMALFSVFAVISQLFLSEPTIIKEVLSPDGKYTAYIYESNGGATTDFIYHLSIVKTGKKLRKGNGNAYSSQNPVEVVWISNRKLYVNNIREIAYTQKAFVKGVWITYKYLSK